MALLELVNSDAAFCFGTAQYPMPMAEKKPQKTKRLPKLEAWQTRDAERLFELFKIYRINGGLPQDEFAEKFDLKSQGNLGHYLHGRQPLGLEAALAFARGMKVSVEEFSPTIADEIDASFLLARKGRTSAMDADAIKSAIRDEVRRQVQQALAPEAGLGEPIEQLPRFGNGGRH